MSTARAMRKQNELLRDDGIRDGLARGEKLQRRKIIEYLKRRYAAATLAGEKAVLLSIKDDIEANVQETVPLPDGVVE